MKQKLYVADPQENACMIRTAAFMLEMIKKYYPVIQSEQTAKDNHDEVG